MSTDHDHLRARLTDVSDRLLVAHDVDAVAVATALLVAVLQDELWARPTAPDPGLDSRALQLVREALDLLTNPESTLNLRDWAKTAEQLLAAAEVRL